MTSTPEDYPAAVHGDFNPTPLAMTPEQWGKFLAFKVAIRAVTIVKDSTNPHFQSKYASFNGIMQAIAPVLNEHHMEFIHCVAGGCVQTSLVLDGCIIARSSIELPKLDNPQKMGSCMTYFKRYNPVLILGLETEDDDDGNSASPPPRQQPQRQAPQPQQAAQVTYHEPPPARAPTAGPGAYICPKCNSYDHIVVKDTSKGDPAVWCKAPECRQEYGGFQYKVADADEYNAPAPAQAPPDDLPF